ncbi:MAG: hypothetical protein EBQ70_00650, partial [Betaproteobacteria bacterium]|nr:hypothetical protein [Betaproteobacteria bacterium]
FGIGTPNHMLAEMFKQSAGIQKLTHVPYKGASDSSIDLMAGRIDFMIDGATINLAISGKLRALAVTFPKMANATRRSHHGGSWLSRCNHLYIFWPGRSTQHIASSFRSIEFSSSRNFFNT